MRTSSTLQRRRQSIRRVDKRSVIHQNAPMSDYRRARVAGGCYFFTVVTYERRPLFGDVHHVDLLREAFAWTRARRPFDVDAIVILPDHLHSVWRLPEGDEDFSGRWRAIKQFVSRRLDTPVLRRGEKTVWQRRFWEHLIRDEEDWPYSSYGRAVDRGCYPPGWGRTEPEKLRNMTRE